MATHEPKSEPPVGHTERMDRSSPLKCDEGDTDVLSQTHIQPADQVPDGNTGFRRTTRLKKPPTRYDEEYVNLAPESPARPAVKQPRPKRKAAQVATDNIVPEDAAPILEDVLTRMFPDERKEYEGWVELESEPGFFNAMLQELEAKDFKVQEVYGLDADILGFLPKPVHGLIFLFEYEGDNEPNDDSRGDCPDDLWFANQTTANACATVALMNIIMNAEDTSLGTQLQDFKDCTKALPPPHRGNDLDKNDFIRSIHNSVARRIDLIAEDLALDNKYEESLKKRMQKSSRAKRSKANVETNYHYIAYVPRNGQIWELDGLKSKPLCLGNVEGSWLDTASAAIQERMMRNSEYSSYSLLAICQSPLKTLCTELATSLACSRTLHERFSKDSTWVVPDPSEIFTNMRPEQRNMTSESLDKAELTESFVAKTSRLDFDAAAALELAQELKTEQDSLNAQYIAELAAVDEAVETVRGRQRDYTPAIHQWVKALAEKGVLREFIQEMG
ncbi:cysteine proteinase [Annulohypoxylon maeteangense]|uniref:cysteine proteinase n=1 Tax=Annulohypoxylon maeteangense TaxID=1927788 RepID=UPI0020074754|nr:cysteine proteinase [Annulohypoxylon maeteangense]KAI0880971.1 cysteine proteinase [Annulohypoxylon maeteangense]